jgi:hypothetical protein
MDEGWTRARLIPVKGIATDKEAEERATSALLAVLSIVRPLSIELFSPLGASKAVRATVECFTEIPFTLEDKKFRPDGLVRVTYGQTAWSALVEVKTGSSTLHAEQIQAYIRIARGEKINAGDDLQRDRGRLRSSSGARCHPQSELHGEAAPLVMDPTAYHRRTAP